MLGINKVELIGALAQDPELRYTATGLAVLTFTLAGESRVGDQEIPWYHRVKLLGNSAEFWAERLKAGNIVYIDGRLDYRAWEEDGQKRSLLDVKGLRVEKLEGGPTVTDGRGQVRLKGGLNRVLLGGNLTRDAELKPQGVLRFGVAINERYSVGEEIREGVHYVDVQAWGELAQTRATLRKGQAVLVEGRLKNDSWIDQDDNRRYATRVEASRIEQVERPERGDA